MCYLSCDFVFSSLKNEAYNKSSLVSVVTPVSLILKLSWRSVYSWLWEKVACFTFLQQVTPRFILIFFPHALDQSTECFGRGFCSAVLFRSASVLVTADFLSVPLSIAEWHTYIVLFILLFVYLENVCAYGWLSSLRNVNNLIWIWYLWIRASSLN